MKFCPKCGALMLPKKENNKKILACSCGYKDKEFEEQKITEKVENKKDIEVIDEEIETNPMVDNAECPKCGHKKAYYWQIQTRASDEPATKFFKCEKCKHIWRDYS